MRNKNHIVEITIFVLLIVVPFSAGLIYAFLYSFGLIGILNHGFTLSNWENVLIEKELWQSLGYSFYIAGISLLIAVVLALSFIIHKRIWSFGTSWLIYLPLTFPALVAAFFTFEFLSDAGFISRIFYGLHLTKGLQDFPDLVNGAAGAGIIITHVMLALPFFIILFRNYYESENLRTLKELSFTLGATESQFNRKILIPALLKKTAAPLTLYFIFMLGSYEIPLLLGRQEPQMISVLVNRKLSRFNLHDVPQAYIISIVYTILVCAMLVLVVRKKNSAGVITS